MIRVEARSDPEAAFRIEQAMGWPRGKAEIARRFAVAHGFLALEGDEPVGAASLAIYRGADDRPAFAWIGGMAVLPAKRGQGLARRLLDACLASVEEAGVPTVGLDATQMGRPVYEKAGFRAVGGSSRWARAEGAPAPRPSLRHSVHPISLSEAMEIAEYDLARFGAKRLPWLLASLHDHPWRAFMARDRATGNVSGFALGHERMVAPLVADDAEAAGALLAACEVAGAPGVLLAMDDHEEAAKLLRGMGWAPDGAACTRMLRGGELPMRREALFGIGTWALG